MILHRWEYDPFMRLHRCVASDIPNRERCVGCGTVISDEELCDFLDGGEPGTILWASLNFIASSRLMH